MTKGDPASWRAELGTIWLALCGMTAWVFRPRRDKSAVRALPLIRIGVVNLTDQPPLGSTMYFIS